MKDKNFLIFRDFSRIFLNLFRIIFDFFKIKKYDFISRADVGADVAEHRHMPMCVHTTWRRTCAYVCVQVCASV